MVQQSQGTDSLAYVVSGTGFAAWLMTPDTWVLLLTALVLILKALIDMPKACASLKLMIYRKKRQKRRASDDLNA